MKFSSKVGEGTRELMQSLKAKSFDDACDLLLRYGNECFAKGYHRCEDDTAVAMMEEEFSEHG
jgi:hypothetical protein